MTFWPPLRVLAGLLGALLTCGAIPLGAVPAADAPEAARVVILANAADPESRALAAYYAQARGIPAENIVALALPEAETIEWPVFVSTLINPLYAELVARGWIDAMPSSLTDDYGRRKAVVSGHRISYLVAMRGVPLRVAEQTSWHRPTVTGSLAANQAAVDAELALLVQSGTPVAGVVENPLYRRRNLRADSLPAQSVVRVARLDAPTPEQVRGMIDGALAAERRGLAGRAYVDIGGTPGPDGNAWLESVARGLAAAGYETEVDRAVPTFPALARFDAPALYFGWYAWNVDGPFNVPGFRFPPGAIAVHIHSFSAATLRAPAKHWCGPFLARGAAATLGNVYEPYLGLTHHLDLFVEALLRGETFGAAAYYALPGLSWQGVALGDPLYRPFAVDAEAQYAQRAAFPPELQPYVVLRRARLALDAGRKDEAARLARGAFRESPSVPVGVSVAQLLRVAEDDAAAVRALAFLELLPRYDVRELGAVRAAAALLTECGAPAKALALYDKALATPPAVGEVELLEEAIRAASRAGLPARAERWQSRLLQLKPPVPAK